MVVYLEGYMDREKPRVDVEIYPICKELLTILQEKIERKIN